MLSHGIRKNRPRTYGQTMLEAGAIKSHTSPRTGTRIRIKAGKNPAQAVSMVEHEP